MVRNVFDHPVCASEVASQHLLDCAATPPLEEGNSGSFKISSIGQHAGSIIDDRDVARFQCQREHFVD